MGWGVGVEVWAWRHVCINHETRTWSAKDVFLKQYHFFEFADKFLLAR